MTLFSSLYIGGELLRNQILIIIGLIIFIELFILKNGGVLFLLVALGLYLYSLKKDEKTYAGVALVFFVLAVLSMQTVVWLVPIGVIYWMYKKYYLEETFGYVTPSTPFAWQDLVVHKLFGPIVIDTTNTILPLEPTFISVTQGLGRTTVYIPYDVTCTVHISQGFGKVSVNGVESQKMRFEIESDSRRKVMLQITNGIGEVEIWQK